MTEESGLISSCFGLPEERARELIENYGRKPWEEYLLGKITSGTLLITAVNLDNLTTNEKCFLTSHLTQSVIFAQMELKRRMKIAELLSGDLP